VPICQSSLGRQPNKWVTRIQQLAVAASEVRGRRPSSPDIVAGRCQGIPNIRIRLQSLGAKRRMLQHHGCASIEERIQCTAREYNRTSPGASNFSEGDAMLEV
jgi:hypothetical protein